MNTPKTLRGALKPYYLLTIRSTTGELLLIEQHPVGLGAVFAKLSTEHKHLTREQARSLVRHLTQAPDAMYAKSGVVRATLQAKCVGPAIMNFNPKELLS